MGESLADQVGGGEHCLEGLVVAEVGEDGLARGGGRVGVGKELAETVETGARFGGEGDDRLGRQLGLEGGVGIDFVEQEYQPFAGEVYLGLEVGNFLLE